MSMTKPQSIDQSISHLQALGRRWHSSLNITGLLLGGSTIYQHIENGTVGQARDWDSVLVVESKADIHALVNAPEQRSKLKSLLGIDIEEFVSLACPSPDDSCWEHFDALRFAGYRQDGVEKSVKILSEEHFMDPNARGFNILSFKDRRIYEFASADGSPKWRIQQATRVDKNLAVLHEDWVYYGKQELCEHGRQLNPAVFGATADMIMTGLWAFGAETVGAKCVNRLLQHYKRVTGNALRMNVFARHPRFGSWYRRWTMSRLQVSDAPEDICMCPSKTLFVHNELSLDKYPLERWDSEVASFDLAVENRLLQALEHVDGQITGHDGRPKEYAMLSSNSQCQWLNVRLDDDDAAPIAVFCKKTEHASSENLGAILAAQYYPRVQTPLNLSQDRLAYPLFNGRTQAELRFDWLKGRCQKSQLMILLMDTELRMVEDTLRAYAMSIADPRDLGKQQSLLIHRFFHHRLASPGTRLREFYGDGLEISGKNIPLELFINASIDVNGRAYPSLRSICKRAEYLLQPDGELSLSPVAFGLGDAHGGNVMIAAEKNAHGHHSTLYIDYEIAGFHSLILDLAKPLYNDVFFSTLISDIVPEDDGDIRFHISDHKLEISLVLDADCISKITVEIKRRHLVEPLRKLLRVKGLCIDRYVPHLAHALFACALLTRNYGHNLRSLMRSVAVGVILSQTTCWNELWDRCNSLVGIT